MNTMLLGLALGLGMLGLGGIPLQAQPLTRAQVIEIPEAPVFWAQPPVPEAAATVGTQVQTGGYLRTQRPGKAQVRLHDGVMFRLGGDALLEITDGDLNLQQGQIIAWADPGTPGSRRRIQTPLATAAIRSSTVFIEQMETGSRIFSWAGEVEIYPAEGGDPVILAAGEELVLKPDMTQLPTPQKMSRADLEARFAQSDLLNGFESAMSTLDTIREELLSP
ncbi:FecR family protein [Synechococcus sp. Nb3U1]|uniref:FecR domain-containing protein n=1 Tax=Synechococcus sp. Nb3U1 TaxID=1914529 RepID=UPI001F364850|nr:FecR domain-containing protein [Synechococcus sp. Nb3U1]MCF2969945.1 FecR family protein [Synechococcus sp. Nb3U1]